jgi:hypothetical protein
VWTGKAVRAHDRNGGNAGTAAARRRQRGCITAGARTASLADVLAGPPRTGVRPAIGTVCAVTQTVSGVKERETFFF